MAAHEIPDLGVVGSSPASVILCRWGCGDGHQAQIRQTHNARRAHNRLCGSLSRFPADRPDQEKTRDPGDPDQVLPRHCGQGPRLACPYPVSVHRHLCTRAPQQRAGDRREHHREGDCGGKQQNGKGDSERVRESRRPRDRGGKAPGKLPQRLQAKELTVRQVHQELVRINREEGKRSQSSKLRRMLGLISNSFGVETRYLIRIFEGKLKIGLRS